MDTNELTELKNIIMETKSDLKAEIVSSYIEIDARLKNSAPFQWISKNGLV